MGLQDTGLCCRSKLRPHLGCFPDLRRPPAQPRAPPLRAVASLWWAGLLLLLPASPFCLPQTAPTRRDRRLDAAAGVHLPPPGVPRGLPHAAVHTGQQSRPRRESARAAQRYLPCSQPPYARVRRRCSVASLRRPALQACTSGCSSSRKFEPPGTTARYRDLSAPQRAPHHSNLAGLAFVGRVGGRRLQRARGASVPRRPLRVAPVATAVAPFRGGLVSASYQW